MNGAQYENQQATGANPESQENYNQGQVPPQAPRQQNFAPPRTDRHKSPALATIFSCMPGVGQVYVGYYQQGFVNMLVVASTIAILSSNAVRGMEPFFGVGLAFFWIYNMIDANRRAHHYNNAMDGLTTEDMPEDFKLPKGRGSLFGGAILVFVGTLIILDLNFDISMAWVEDWWPLLLIAFGGNLIYKARQKEE